MDPRVAQLYDLMVPDWPGEIEFYRGLAAEAARRGQSVLEIACGTGRVTLRLAEVGTSMRIVGVDRSAAALDVARAKDGGQPGARWVEADMRSFDLEERFGLVIIPGHSFQFMLTPDDQLACLLCVRRHLVPGGLLAVHLDLPELGWLWGVHTTQGGVFEPAQAVADPRTGHIVHVARAWWYAPSTQTASAVTRFEAVDRDGAVVERWETGPTELHVIFPTEMMHLLARAGFDVIAVYGDFFRNALNDDSAGMVWLVRG